jgi:uncharacterized membrane protein
MARFRTPLRWLLAAVMVAAGTAHFLTPDALARIVPAFFPNPRLMVAISGVAEVAGGLGLVCPWPILRRAAAWGLVALYVAVFPANVNQAVNHIQPVGSHVPEIVFWLRLPVQAVLIALAWWFTRPDPA